MANDYYMKLDTQNLLDALDNVAFEQYQTQSALEKMVEALEQIIDTPNKMATDSRALREMVRIAQAALDEVVEYGVADQST